MSTYKARKATFTVSGKGEQRIFTPVNRRAQIVAKKLNKRTITTAGLRSTLSAGSYKMYAYNKGDGRLKAIRV